MSTVTLWLLIAFNYGSSAGVPAATIERFATSQECERVRTVLLETVERRFRCVQATVVRP